LSSQERKFIRKDCVKTKEVGDIVSTGPYKMELMLEEEREDQMGGMCMVIEKYVVKV
jgi:hypothetical protein